MGRSFVAWIWLKLVIVGIVSIICAVMNFNLVWLMTHEKGLFAQWELTLIPIIVWWIISIIASSLFWARYRHDLIWMSATAKWLTIINTISIIALIISFILKL